jgi:protein-tyrosine phosphatase
MIDLHCHLLPGIDDGARDLEMTLAMARAFVADGVTIVACTPHILPGLYHNTGPQISAAVANLQRMLAESGIPLNLVAGADNHIVQNFVGGLRTGHLLGLAGSRYVLVEPPHHVMPVRLDDLFFDLSVAGYVPILTHPERLTWIKGNYAVIERLAQKGVWMQITAGSLTGAFGRGPKYWAERMLDEGLVQIIATDAHDVQRRPPNLAEGRRLAATRVGEEEAWHLVYTRPRGVLDNVEPGTLPAPSKRLDFDADHGNDDGLGGGAPRAAGGARQGFAGRLRRLFE